MNNSNDTNEIVYVPITEKYLLTVTESNKYTGIGTATLRQLMKSGRLKTIKIGRKNMIHRLELEKFLDEAADERMTI